MDSKRGSVTVGRAIYIYCKHIRNITTIYELPMPKPSHAFLTLDKLLVSNESLKTADLTILRLSKRL